MKTLGDLARLALEVVLEQNKTSASSQYVSGYYQVIGMEISQIFDSFATEMPFSKEELLALPLDTSLGVARSGWLANIESRLESVKH